MLRATVAAPWPKLVSTSNVGTIVRPFFGSGLLVGKDGGILVSSLKMKTNHRSRDDEIMDQTSYSDAFDESDALEMGKQRKDVGSSENKHTSVSKPWMSRLAEQASFWESFNSDWLLQQPRGNSFAPFYFGGRDPFVFHDTFLPVLLAKQEEVKEGGTTNATLHVTGDTKMRLYTYTLPQKPVEQEDGWGWMFTPGKCPEVVSCYDDTVQTNFSDAFDESDWAEAGKQKKAAG